MSTIWAHRLPGRTRRVHLHKSEPEHVSGRNLEIPLGDDVLRREQVLDLRKARIRVISEIANQRSTHVKAQRGFAIRVQFHDPAKVGSETGEALGMIYA